MSAPYFTHDNMGHDYEVVYSKPGKWLKPGIYHVREIGQLKLTYRRIDSALRVSEPVSIWARFMALFK